MDWGHISKIHWFVNFPKVTFFCLSLDESLNKISQTKQMHIIVRYFDCSKNEITSRYLTSTFLGHSTAKDLLESFTTCLSNLGLSLDKVIQIETDGPNVNLKFLRDFADHVKEEFDSKLLDIGTCSLHIVHGVFKTAHKQTKWEIHEFLRCIYYLFKAALFWIFIVSVEVVCHQVGRKF